MSWKKIYPTLTVEIFGVKNYLIEQNEKERGCMDIDNRMEMVVRRGRVEVEEGIKGIKGVGKKIKNK